MEKLRFMKVDISVFFENLLRIAGTLHEDQYAFIIISHCILLRMRNVPDTILEKIKTRFVFNNLPSPPKIVSL